MLSIKANYLLMHLTPFYELAMPFFLRQPHRLFGAHVPGIAIACGIPFVPLTVIYITHISSTVILLHFDTFAVSLERLEGVSLIEQLPADMHRQTV